MYGTDERIHVKVGAITLVAIIVLLAGITIGRGVTISTASVHVRIRAANAAGLEAGAPVWINGIKRGSIISVRPDGDSVLIIAGIDDASILRSDAHAKIAMLEITGGKRLDILPGSSKAPWDGAVLHADPAGDLSHLFAAIEPLARGADVLIRRLDTTVRAFNATIASPATQEQLHIAIERSSQLIAELQDAVTSNRAAVESIIADLRISSKELREALVRNRPTIEQLLDRLERLSSNLDTLVSNARQLSVRADTTLGHLNVTLDQLRTQQTAIGKLLYDEQFAMRIDSTLGRIAGLVDTISRFGINVNVRLGTRP